MKGTIMRALVGGLLLFISLTASSAVATPYTVQPGTVSIPVGNETFSVTTDQTIVIDLAFTSAEIIEGSVNVANGQAANVLVVWPKMRLTVFDARVVVTTLFRFDVPKRYQAQEDAGHSEK